MAKGTKKGARRRANHKESIAKRFGSLPKPPPVPAPPKDHVAGLPMSMLVPALSFMGGLAGASIGVEDGRRAIVKSIKAELAQEIRDNAKKEYPDILATTGYERGFRDGLKKAAELIEAYRG